ncbi:MAG TPA: pyridoxal 5'-phosphate synthase, partial [Tenuifilum sp.]|uniref:pyridoxine/pyridoxamine 5'-phosphate oxidase n=1 Tax=Tenuifilum sp. TaxID=2760880 RepID=UPI002CD8543F|nr:pyridoxal 5'-phosphate synthase [Tenuifilum sp.]
MSPKDLNALRHEYSLKSLNENEVKHSPIDQFDLWLNEAISSGILEPNAMILATSTFDGKPSARVVLLKHYDEKGLSFFTNYESRKAKNILQNPYGALVFFWPDLERQVRIEGKIHKATDAES